MSNATPTGLAATTALVVRSREAGSTVGSFTATDPEGGALTFTASHPLFEFVGNELRLREDADLGPRAPATFTLRVTATDAEGASVTRAFTLQVEASALVRDVRLIGAGAGGAAGPDATAPAGRGGAGEAGAAMAAMVDGERHAGSAQHDRLGLVAEARGGAGGAGGEGGDDPASATGGAGGPGGAGGQAVALVGGTVLDLRQGGADLVDILARATGGAGGPGGLGGLGLLVDPPDGGSSPAIGAPGAGGAGGGALAAAMFNTVTARHLTATLRTEAFGGAGGEGAGPGPAGDAEASVSRNVIRATEGRLDLTLAATAVGGTSLLGEGGEADAKVATNVITAAGADDLVSIMVVAAPGTNGVGVMFPSSASFAENVIRLGGGDDRLAIGLSAGQVRFEDNILSGGSGHDTLALDPLPAGIRADLWAGTLSVADGARNFITGFEAVIGGEGDDDFVAGRTDSTFTGGRGADTFVFRRTAADHVVTDFTPVDGDLLVLERFGALLNTERKFAAALADTAEGALLTYAAPGRATGSILFEGLTEEEMLAAYRAGSVTFLA